MATSTAARSQLHIIHLNITVTRGTSKWEQTLLLHRCQRDSPSRNHPMLSIRLSPAHFHLYDTLLVYRNQHTSRPYKTQQHDSKTLRNTRKWCKHLEVAQRLPPAAAACTWVLTVDVAQKWITASSSLDNYTPSHPRQNPENTPGIQWERFTVLLGGDETKGLTCFLQSGHFLLTAFPSPFGGITQLLMDGCGLISLPPSPLWPSLCQLGVCWGRGVMGGNYA